VIICIRKSSINETAKFLEGQKDLLFSPMSRLALEFIQPSYQWIPQANSLGLKQYGNEAEHSPQSSAEIKNV
jgi:hypothetical protein